MTPTFPKRMRLLLIPSLAFLYAFLYIPIASALGLGELQIQSRLGAPFKATITIRSDQPLYTQCFTLSVAPGQTTLGPLKNALLEYQSTDRGGKLEISTSRPVADPTVQFLLQVACEGALQREYIGLLDLPGNVPTERQTPAALSTLTDQNTSSSTAAVSPAQKAKKAKRVARSPNSVKGNAKPKPSAEPVSAPPATIPEPSQPIPTEKTAPAESSQPIEQPTAPQPPEPSLQASAPPQPAATTEENDASFPSLEWLVAGITLLLGFVLALIWYSRRQHKQAASPDQKPSHSSRSNLSLENDDDFPTLITQPKAATTPVDDVTFDLGAAQPEETPREVKPSPGHDKVLDLAEIMLSFGQSESAMKALRDFVSDHPDEAIDPWLRLLDLLRRDNRREEFEALSDQLSKTFNVAPTTWEPANPGLSLASDPGSSTSFTSIENFVHIRKHLIENWGTVNCARYLDVLLRDNRKGERKGFPIEIIEEIVLLRNLLALRMNEG